MLKNPSILNYYSLSDIYLKLNQELKSKIPLSIERIRLNTDWNRRISSIFMNL